MIEVFNDTNIEVNFIEKIKEIVKYTLEKENCLNGVINIIFVDNKKIHDINKEYRHIDRETDVISFALEDDNTLINPSDMRILGDIYISLEKAKSQALEYNHSFERELCFLTVHGVYHLLGYDHMTKEEEKIMFQKQEEVLYAFAITR